jgi:FkbM family methyltransferase
MKKSINLKKNTLKDLINFFFKNKITIIDAGVHRGDFLKKKIGLKKINKALMIDPVMQENIKKLTSKKFKFLNMALGNKKSEVSFYIHSKKYPEWSALYPISKKSPYNTHYKKYLTKPQKKKITQETLNNLLKKKDIVNYLNLKKKKIDILKIDCQSTTLQILQGASQILNKNKLRMIIAAINPYTFYENKCDDFIKILKYLESKNFELINIVNAHTGELGSLNYSYSDFKIWTFDAIFVKKK